MSKTIYIAGKISGQNEKQVREKFERAASELQGEGNVILSRVNNKADNWKNTVRNSIKAMLDCDEIHLLPGWQESRGAQLERDIALRLGMNIVYR